MGEGVAEGLEEDRPAPVYVKVDAVKAWVLAIDPDIFSVATGGGRVILFPAGFDMFVLKGKLEGFTG